MEQGFLYMDLTFSHLLQDDDPDLDLFWNPTDAFYAPPIAISMSTRIISSPDLAGTEAGSSSSRSQRPIGLEIDAVEGEEGAGSGTGGQYNQIRPTTSSFSLPLPPLIPNTRRAHRSSSPTTTTQQPRPSHSPPGLPLLDIQTPPRRRATNLPPANVELLPINGRENEHLGQHSRSRDLENLLLSANFGDPDLVDFVDGDFSSPSTYPSFTNTDPQPSQVLTSGVSQTAALQASISAPHRAVANSATTAPRDPSAAHHCISNFLGPERSTTQLSSSTNAAGESQSTLPIFDFFDESDILFDSPASSFSDAMPPALRRSVTAATPRPGSTHTGKRRRTSTAAANGNTISKRPSSRQKKSSAPKKEMEVEELFGSSPPPRAFVDLETNEDYDTVDLTETNEIPDDIEKPEKDDRIKLAAFQCVICMDDCNNLTVTHCGHLYCASCLHQSLSVDATKGKCPMCRQKLDMKTRENYSSKTKGYWPLELKLMTATRKGKRKANTLS
ncbi:e3 ubiquitin-protein ligase complex slx8-rfp subunit slx8 [Fusarium langsethiae]|uniref:E3 ubiquitin-protein ligase complex slx8-rfp subunit slx8 n=1 Tax=Fusarium langsethiae TaxID=179993 RepID=A0A0M9EXP5_FUSLA|nr:e3 ubiquitin-protein ligase complex slx8-rfp subunit slx8 [Fusarium langsethiae]GKU02924.1 unnamed protein product [Fusarium langsethiae]GKU18353.1 unnamed protein product [Fusarium langsethiae]